MDETTSISVRDAVETDMNTVQAIYTHHVLHGLASFEETPPDVAEMARRWRNVCAWNLPYLVAEESGEVQGYAYTAPFRDRTAYRYTVENSVYIAEGATGRGLGRALLGGLIDRCTALGFRRMIAVIGDSGNLASIAVHRKLGFRDVGIIPATGFKHERWVDTVLMERPLGQGETTLPE